ncbi:hypothetical protein ACJJIR_10590 [Microbulbifer sp. SSSA008]|uniref:hypothetical protein n=1 Tax=Microbulbifer sp. SSSA008 TaxID=3243380 RepID=UPI00403908F1
MVAVISGEALGLFNSTQAGVGSASFGQGRESIYVNASTGNLVLRQQDEFVAASGLDLSLLRTYNSQGQLDGDNNDGFRFNFSNQLTNLVGTPNQPGSQITRIGSDGAETIYRYDASLQAYISSDGAGAHDQILFDSGNNQWVWREGSSRVEEVYGGINGNWKMVARVDAEGRQVVFGHNSSGLVDTVTDAAGQTLAITYSGTRVTGVTVSSDGTTEQRLHYSYDAQGRLEAVTVDLSPQDSSIADGNVYTTTYEYDGDSTRVATVLQSDGSLMRFYYTDVDGQGDYRISEVHSGRVASSGMALEFDNSDRRITTYSYDLGSNKTTITQIDNPEAGGGSWTGVQTELTFDSAGRITEMKAPADQNGVRELTQYRYDADGNLLSLTDHSGDTTTYEYDSRGNQTLVRDAQGNTVEREYDSANQLSKETVYLRPDPDGAGAEQPSEARVTHYVYDDQQRLRFVVGHDGTVQETRYSDAAQNAEHGIPARTVSGITYLQHGYFDQFDAANYSEASTENPVDFAYSTLTSWVQNTQSDIQANSLHNATRRSDTRLDFRGQVYSVTAYSAVGSDGEGIADGSESTQYTVYDANGQLRSTVDPRGGAQDASSYKTSYIYDGLGRLLSSTDAEGHTSTTLYSDAQSQVISTDADGLQITRSYATNGSLISEIRHDTTNGNATLGETRFFYDTLGRIRATQDAIGAISHSLYDDKGQMVAVISASGAITEFHYDEEGRQVQSTHYANRLSSSQLQSLLQKDNDGQVIGIDQSITLADLRPTAIPDSDRSTYQYYDDAGQVRFLIDAEGYLSETQYNAQGQVLRTTQYDVKIQNPQGETTDTLAAKYAASNAHLSVTSDSATQWLDPQQSYAQADSLGFNQRSIVNQNGSIDLSQSATTRPAQNPYVLSGTINARVENTHTETVSGSAITTAYTRPPVQPYTYASTAIVAEQFTDTDNRTLSVRSEIEKNDPSQPYTYSTTAHTRVSAPSNQTKTVSVYREHSNVNSTNSATKLKAGSFTPRTAYNGGAGLDIFDYWTITVTVTRTDGSLPSGYDGTFSYDVTADWARSITWDGSVDLTKYYGDNLPAGNYSVKVVVEEFRDAGVRYKANTYTQTKTFNVGTRIKWTDPTYGQSKTTKFYYKSTSSSNWLSRSFTSSGHTNTVVFDNPGSGNYNFRIDYRNGNYQGGVHEVGMRGEGTFSTIATSNQSLSTSFKGVATTNTSSNSSVIKYYTDSLPSNIKTIKAVSVNKATGASYTAYTYPQDIERDGFNWNGKINLRTGSKLPDGQYDITLTINGAVQSKKVYYEIGNQYEYKTTKITWPISTQPGRGSVFFKYRINGSNSKFTIVSPTGEGANHVADLGVIGNVGTKKTYEYLIEYVDGNQIVKSATGTFVVDKDGKTTDSSAVNASFEFESVRYVEKSFSTEILGYFSETLASTISRADVRVLDKKSGALVSTASTYPADYLLWLKNTSPNNYSYDGHLNLDIDQVLGSGRYEVEVTTYNIDGDEIDSYTFDYEIGTQTEHHPTSFQWPVSSRPVSSDKTIFEYEVSPDTWQSVPVLEDGNNLKVILGDVDDKADLEGTYNFRIRYEQNGVTVKQTTGSPSLTVGKGVTNDSSFDFEYTVVSLQSGSGHAISGYPVSIGSDPALDKIVAQVKDSNGQLVSTAETYPQLFGSYNGEVNLAIGSELAAGQAYSVTLTLHYDDGSSSVRAAFPVEVGEQSAQDQIFQWSDNLTTANSSGENFNFNSVSIIDNPREGTQDGIGSYSISANGDTLRFTGNAWKGIAFDYTITEDTIVELEFRSDSAAEIQGFGFDVDGEYRDQGFVQLAGTQNVSTMNSTYKTYSVGDGWVRYRIPVGQLGAQFLGEHSMLYFANDKDINRELGDSSFRNFRIFEGGTAAEVTHFEYRRVGSESWQSTLVNQNGSDFTANLGYELSGDYEYRIATYRDADGNGLSDNDRLLRTLSGTFAANDSGTESASWDLPSYERSSAEGYALEGYLSAAEAADIAYLETVVIDNATGSPVSAQPAQTWIDPATLRDGSFAGRLNLLVGETLADGDYSVQVTRHSIDGSSQVDATFQQQVGRQLQSVTNPQLSLGLDEAYSASGVSLSIRPLGSGQWETLSLDPATGTVELDKDVHANGVYEYQLSYTLDVDGVPVSKSGVGRFTLAAGESYTQALSATATGVDLADARIGRSFYDDAGRVSATLDAEGYLTEYRYNRAGQLVSSTRYANRVADYEQSSHWLNSGTLQTLRPAADPAADRSNYWLYDGQGREVAEINAEGYVTEHEYDVAGNRVKSTQYATALGDLDSALAAVEGDPARLSLAGVDFVRHRFNDRDSVDVSRWQIADSDPPGATVVKVYDTDLQRDVVEVSGDDVNNAFILRKNSQFESWNITDSTTAKAELKLSGKTFLYYRIETSEGAAYVQYSSTVTEPYIHVHSSGIYNFYTFPLDAKYLDGNWQTFERDIQADVAYLDPTVTVEEIDWFTVRGSGRIGTVEILTDTLEAAGTDIPGQLRPQASGADRISEWRYDGRNQVTHATDASGNTSTFTYTAGGQLASSRSGIMASGSILDNYLDNYQGDPTFSANDSEARDYQFEYDVQGRVIAERDHRGRVVLSHSYDDSGRRISSTDANGYTTHFAYSADGLLKYSLAPVFNPGNNSLEWQLSSFSHNAFGEVTGTRQYASRLSNTAFNNLGLAGDAATLDNLAASLADGDDTVTSTVYTQRGLVDNSTDGEGFITTAQYNAFGERTRLSQAIDVANSRQAVTDFSYSRRGELETSSAQLSSGPFASITSSTVYNAFGEAVSSTDARGYSTDYAYDRLGQLLTQTDALAQQTHLSYDAFGRVLTRTDALNRSTRYEYDDANRSQTVTTPEGVQTRTVSNVHGETFEVSIKVGDSWLRQARYDYDTQGNLTDTTDALGNSARSEYNAAGQLTASVDASGVRTELTYDPQGRVLTRTQDVGGLNLTTTQRYGHRYEETVDASGSATRTEYDKNGRVSRVIVDASSDGSGLNLLTQYRYDGQGNVLEVQEGSLSGGIDGSASIKRTTAYSYDELGRVLSETLDPNGLAITTRYEYDQAGNRTAMTNALGHSTYFVYDELGRERYVLSPFSTDATWYSALEKKYDAAGQLSAITEHRSTYNLPETLDIPSVAAIYNLIVDEDRTTRYVYNDDGQLTHSIDALGYVTETVYSSTGRVSAVIRYADRIDPSSETVDDLVRDTSNDRETRYQYDAAGRQTHTLRLFEQGGVQYAYVTESLYNSRGEVVGEIAYARALNLASETTADLDAQAADNRHSTFIYDAAGRRTHTVDSLGYVTETRYDDSNDTETVIRYANGIAVPAASGWADLSAADLAISASSQHDQVIVTQYDAAGRKASLTEKVWAEGALQNYVESYQYDALGNRTQISDPRGFKTYFSYDAAGRLTHKQVPRNTTQGYLSTWSYDALGQVLSETHYSQAVAQNADPSAINTNTLAHAQDRSTHYTYMSNGKLRTETDSAGVVTLHDYNAFGEIWRTTEAKDLAEQRVTIRGFDQLGRLVEETSGLPDRDASTVSNRHNLTEAELGADEQVATTYFGYNSFGELETLVSPRGPSYTSQQLHDQLGRKVGEIDARGGSTQTVLDAFGNIVATTDPNGNTGVFLYDANNQLTHQVTPDGAVTTYRYDAFGQATDVRTYAQTLAASTDIAALDRAALESLLGNLQDPIRDRHSVSVYDNRGQLLTSTQHGYDLVNGHATANTATYEYDKAGNRTAVIDANGARTDYHYDAQGRVIQETGPEYAATLTYHNTGTTQVRAITKYSYNAFDKTFAGDGYYWDVSAGEEKTSAYGIQNRYMRYDHNGQLLALLGPAFVGASDSALDSPDFDGSISTVWIRSVTERRYDALGRLVYEGQRGMQNASLSDDGSANGTQHGQVQATAYSYNRLDQQVYALDADGGLTYSTYDAAGNLRSETRYDQRLTINDSAWDGSLTGLNLDNSAEHWRTDAQALQGSESSTGRTTHYQYNANNLVTKTESDAGVFFDLNNLVDPDSTSGDQQELQNGFSLGSTQSSQALYDANGNAIIQIDGKDQSSFALYDSAGNRVLEVDRLGYVTEYLYDGLGQITAQTRYADALNFSGLGAPADNEARHAWLDNLYGGNRAALVANIASGDERTTEYVYSGRGLLLEERIKGESFSRISNSGTALNITQVSSDLVTRYDYDGNGQAITTVRYDGDENAADSRVESASYNARGEQVQMQGAEYTDYRGQSVRGTVSYRYDLFGHRTAEIVHNDSGNQVTSHYYNMIGKRLETRDARENSGDANYEGKTRFYFDAFGNAVYQSQTQTDIDNARSQVITWLQYDAAGREIARSNNVDKTELGGRVQHDIAYNTHGQIVGKGINTDVRDSVIGGKYQEYYVYDELGRLFKTNADNGSPRIYLYDQNGNASLEITAINNDSLDGIQTARQAMNELTQSETQWKYSLYDQEDQLITVVEAPLATPSDNADLDVGWDVDNDNSEVTNSVDSEAGTDPTITGIGSAKTATNSTATSRVWVNLNSGNMPTTADTAVSNKHSLPAERGQTTVRSTNVNYVDGEGKGYASNSGGATAVDGNLSWVDNTDELLHLSSDDPRLNFEELGLTAKQQTDLAGLLGSTNYPLDGTSQGHHQGYVERDVRHYYTSRQVTLDSGREITVFTNRIEEEEQLHVFVPLFKGSTQYGWREVVITTNAYNYDINSDFLQADDSAADSALEDAQNNPLQVMPSLDWSVDGNTLSLDSSDVASVFGNNTKVKVLAKNSSGQVVMDNVQYNWSDGMDIALNSNAAAVSLTFLSADGLVLHAVDLYSDSADSLNGSVGLPGEGVGLEHLPEVNKFWLSAGYQSSKQGSSSKTSLAYSDSAKVLETTYATEATKSESYPGKVEAYGDVKVIYSYVGMQTKPPLGESAVPKITFTVSGLNDATGAKINTSFSYDGERYSKSFAVTKNGTYTVEGTEVFANRHGGFGLGDLPEVTVSMTTNGQNWGTYTDDGTGNSVTKTSPERVKVYDLPIGTESIKFVADGKTKNVDVPTGQSWVYVDTSSMNNSATSLAFELWAYSSNSQKGTVLNHAKGNFNNNSGGTVTNITNAVTKTLKIKTYTHSASSEGDSYTSVFYSQVGMYNREAIRNIALQLTGAANDETLIAHHATYNAFGETVASIDNNGNATLYEYDQRGNVAKELKPEADVYTEQMTKFRAHTATEYGVNAFGEVVMEKVGAEAAAGASSATRTAITNYNTQHQQVRLQDYEAGLLIASQDGIGDYDTQAYDQAGNLKGSSQRVYYANERGSGTGSLYYQVAYHYDANNQLVRMNRFQDNSLAIDYGYSASNRYDEWDYDEFGNRIRHRNALYDDTNYVLNASFNSSGNATASGKVDQETYRYDGMGRVLQYKSYNGKITDYAYAWSDSVSRNVLAATGQQAQGAADEVQLGGYITSIAKSGMGGAVDTDWNQSSHEDVLSDAVDYFGKAVWHDDLGGHRIEYAYNYAGWLSRQTGNTALSGDGTWEARNNQDIRYTYYHNGNLFRTYDYGNNGLADGDQTAANDGVAPAVTEYRYDKAGNRTGELYYRSNDLYNNLGRVVYQHSNATYDEQGRITNIEGYDEYGNAYQIDYTFDVFGNRRSVSSVYDGRYVDNLDGTIDGKTQSFYYTYDKNNRFTLTLGEFENGQIVLGKTGTAIAYNGLDQRYLASRASDGSIREKYAYDSNGRLTTVHIDQGSGFVLRASRINNDAGQVTAYYEYDSAGKLSSATDNYYNADGIQLGYATTQYDENGLATDEVTRSRNTFLGDGQTVDTTITSAYPEDGAAPTVTTLYNTYEKWDSYKTKSVVISADNKDLHPKQRKSWENGEAFYTYDSNGHIRRVYDVEGERAIAYVTDKEGRTLVREEINDDGQNDLGREMRHFYYFNGHAVGDVGNDQVPSRYDYVKALAEAEGAGNRHLNSNGDHVQAVQSADFDQNYQPINPNYPTASYSSYEAQGGETLQSIAATVWGDSSLWYLLADANGMKGDEVLTKGQRLELPNVVTNIHNNSDTFRPVDGALQMGDTAPTLPDVPPPPADDGGCGALGMILVIVVAVVATVLTAGAFVSVAGASIGSMMAAGAGAIASGTLGLGAAFVAGAVGSIASQATAIGLGMQEDFSWSDVAIGGLTTVATVGAASYLNGIDSFTKMVDGVSKLNWAGSAALGASTAVSSYGINKAFNKDVSFSWRNVATSAVASGVASGLSDGFSQTSEAGVLSEVLQSGSSFGADVGRELTGALINESVQSAIWGDSFDWGGVAIATAAGVAQSSIKRLGGDGEPVAGGGLDAASVTGGEKASARERELQERVDAHVTTITGYQGREGDLETVQVIASRSDIWGSERDYWSNSSVIQRNTQVMMHSAQFNAVLDAKTAQRSAQIAAQQDYAELSFAEQYQLATPTNTWTDAGLIAPGGTDFSDEISNLESYIGSVDTFGGQEVLIDEPNIFGYVHGKLEQSVTGLENWLDEYNQPGSISMGGSADFQFLKIASNVGGMFGLDSNGKFFVSTGLEYGAALNSIGFAAGAEVNIALADLEFEGYAAKGGEALITSAEWGVKDELTKKILGEKIGKLLKGKGLDGVVGYEHSILQGRDYEGGPLKAMGRADAITVGVSGGFTFEDDSKSNDKLKNRFGDLVPDLDITKQHVPWAASTDNTLIGKAVYALAIQTPKNIIESWTIKDAVKNMMGVDGGEWAWK